MIRRSRGGSIIRSAGRVERRSCQLTNASGSRGYGSAAASAANVTDARVRDHRRHGNDRITVQDELGDEFMTMFARIYRWFMMVCLALMAGVHVARLCIWMFTGNQAPPFGIEAAGACLCFVCLTYIKMAHSELTEVTIKRLREAKDEYREAFVRMCQFFIAAHESDVKTRAKLEAIKELKRYFPKGHAHMVPDEDGGCVLVEDIKRILDSGEEGATDDDS